MNYLRLIGYHSLLMIATVQLIIKYFLFVPFQIDITLNGLGIALLIFATLCLAAAGNVIIAISNTTADKINHSKNQIVGNSISEKSAYNLFIALNILGVGIGFYLSNIIGYPGFSALFIIASVLLYVYATYLKKQLVVGNVVIGLLAAMCIILLGLYDLLPVITAENQATQNTIFSILLDYALLAFLLNWLREMTQDQKNIDGDHKAENLTLSVSIGKERTNKCLFGLAVLSIAGVIYYMYTYLFGNTIIVLYVLFLIVAPLLYFLIKILSAKTKKDFSHLYLILTITMWTALFSIGLYKFILL